MSRRDRAWRMAGAGLVATGGLVAVVRSMMSAPGAGEDAAALAGAALALGGLVLLVCGRRAYLALRVEGSVHRQLPFAIHERRGHHRGAHRPPRHGSGAA